jgi:hypothetical protein
MVTATSIDETLRRLYFLPTFVQDYIVLVVVAIQDFIVT